MKINPLTAIDFYKADHRRQYPVGTTMVYSNFTPRSVKYLPKIEGTDDKIVFFGLQYFLRWFLMEVFNEGFFLMEKESVCRAYKRRLDTSLGADKVPIDHIYALHSLGYLPIEICALPEGAAVDVRVPVFTVRSTKDEHFWLTNYLETILSAQVWKMCTSATLARKYKVLFTKYANETGGDVGFVQFQGHDFSFRGMSGIYDAAMSGAAHLTSFVGTDTVPAIDLLEQYYGADCEKELVGCSVPATEHSVMCLNADFRGSEPNERDSFSRLISHVYPDGIVSVVSDSFDFWGVLTNILPSIRGEIMARNGKVVIRPDSGDPVRIIAGYKYAELSEAWTLQSNPEKYEYFIRQGKVYHYYQEGRDVGFEEVKHLTVAEVKGAIELLWETFGGTMTDKEYKVLDQHIGLIYGDSITLERADEIFSRLKDKGFASTNVVLGIGSFTYQFQTRDTLGFAMKATAGVVSGEAREIYKRPKTDSGMKNSAKGLVSVVLNRDGNYILKDQASEGDHSELVPVFRDGKLLVETTLQEVRGRIIAETAVAA